MGLHVIMDCVACCVGAPPQTTHLEPLFVALRYVDVQALAAILLPAQVARVRTWPSIIPPTTRTATRSGPAATGGTGPRAATRGAGGRPWHPAFRHAQRPTWVVCCAHLLMLLKRFWPARAMS